ncbi:hypothetical protein [Burkholderia pseudomallei]|uniref:hypothetical protein n=1 Tax=Burkholderia pseudomallei TaxID=28450 RepID=UPI00100A2DDB|nr:hypothetical protein [Burkholderia pseudomallei]
MIDIEKIEALAEAAPRGEWEVWTSNSWRRVYAGGVPAITPCVQRYDNQPDLSFGDGVREWLEGVTPDVVAELLAEVRRLREDAERYRWAISLEDNVETLYAAVISCGPSDTKSINIEIDAAISLQKEGNHE